MSTDAILVESLYKKFQRGEVHDSLRDLIPALSKRWMKRLAGRKALGEQEFWALQDVNFTIPKGEAVGIIGHNGAGKSTLLKHLTGVLAPNAGSVTMNGRVSALIEVGAGFHPYLTGRENVFLNGVILGMSIVEIRRKFDEIVAFSELEEFIDTPVRRYSSGMFARLGFSVAAHLDPEILLIDEVLSVGDYVFQTKGVAKMQAIVESGATVVFVSHNMRSVQALCSRCIMLDHGRIVADGPSSEVIDTYLQAGRRSVAAAGTGAAVFEHCGLTILGKTTAIAEPGETFELRGAVRANEPLRGTDLIVRIRDANGRDAVHMSLGRLDCPLPDLEPGDRFEFALDGRAHFANGSYEVVVTLYDARRQRSAASVNPPLRLFVGGPMEPRGVVNVYPTVREFTVERAASPAAIAS